MVKFMRGAAGEYLEEKYGGMFVESYRTFTVGLTPVNLFPRDPERTSLVIVNHGNSPIWITCGVVPAVDAGIRVSVSGGSFTTNVLEDAVLPTLEWNAISDLAGMSVFLLSVRRDVIAKEGA